ncbi:MAG: hypothetical protein GXO24_04285 [Chlorobi bacterium]|nr:hypothetical protein [Chlorobiota bacterium]
MTAYILEVLFWQAVFLLLYRLLLRRETFFRFNRLYLLLTPALSFVLPLMRWPVPASVERWTVHLPVVLLDGLVPAKETAVPAPTALSPWWLLYALGVAVSLWFFVRYLLRLRRMIRRNPVLDFPGYRVVLLPSPHEAFSFLRYIFMDRRLYGTELGRHIIQHERVHIRHRHSWDLLYLEILKILFWFDPFWRFFRRELKLVHEYTADAVMVQRLGAETYFNAVLQETFRMPDFRFVNSFFIHKHLKQRVMMHQQNTSVMRALAEWLILGLVVLLIAAGIQACKNSPAPMSETVINDEQLEELVKNGQLDKIQIDRKANFIRIITKDGKKYRYYRTPEELSNKLSDGRASTFVIDTIVNPVSRQDTGNDDMKFAVYPGCESEDNTGLRKCFSEKISNFFVEHLDRKLLESTGKKGDLIKILVVFKIDEDGNAKVIRIQAPSEKAKQEVLRVVEMLPHMQPATRNGQPVEITYTLPIFVRVK